MICFFLFYNHSESFQAKFACKEFKHCDIMILEDNEWYLLQEVNEGLMVRSFKIKSIDIFLRRLKLIEELSGIIGVEILNKVKKKWMPFRVNSCNEFCRNYSFINLPFTLTPKDLYKKLIKLNKKRNYEIIYHWRRENGRTF